MDCFVASLLAMTKNQGVKMAFRQRREKLRFYPQGINLRSTRARSMTPPRSHREDLGFEVGMFGGLGASLAVLGDPDIALITLTELCEQCAGCRVRPRCRAVDADHAMATTQCRPHGGELEAAAPPGLDNRGHAVAAGLRQAKPELISLDEGVGKMKAAVDGRSDASLVVMGRTGRIDHQSRRRDCARQSL